MCTWPKPHHHHHGACVAQSVKRWHLANGQHPQLLSCFRVIIKDTMTEHRPEVRGKDGNIVLLPTPKNKNLLLNRTSSWHVSMFGC